MARKVYLQINDAANTVTFVAEKLTKSEAAQVKGCIACGYEPIRTTAEKMYPTEKKFGKNDVEAFLATKDAKIKKQFDKIADTVATDKNGIPKTSKNGKARKKGYVGALKWFREQYEEEYLKWFEEK